MHDTTKTTRTGMNPIIIMMLIVIITMVLTFVLPSGEYQRKDKLVIPNSYQVIDKPISVANFISASLTEKEKDRLLLLALRIPYNPYRKELQSKVV